jgi:hypothetical protein
VNKYDVGMVKRKKPKVIEDEIAGESLDSEKDEVDKFHKPEFKKVFNIIKIH